MSMRVLLWVLIGVLLMPTVSVVGAQDLFDNDFMQQAIETREQAEEALNAEEYERSIELSKQAQELQRLAREEAERLFAAFRARAFKAQAEGAIDAADRSNALNDELRTVLEDARGFYREGVVFFDDEEFVLSTLSFQNVLATLETARLWPNDSLAALQAERLQRLPEFYRVRLIPTDRDSFSKIAGYDFVYGDITKWPELYQANKDKIVDGDNPDLIHPGQLFVIPSLSGEARGGEWAPLDSDAEMKDMDKDAMEEN